MKITKMLLGSAALMVLSVPVAFAQSGTAAPSGQTIHQRKENQQDRIAQGVRSGQLTPGETAKLEHQESAINHETRQMRAANGGKLTPQDKRIVTRQQNRESRNIYAKKHNGRVQ